jgi:hypothetical protein
MSCGDNPADGSGRFYLTPECECVQREIAALAEGLTAQGAAGDGLRRPAFLREVRRVRRHLGEHVESVETPAGLFDAIELGAAQLTSQLMTLCQEHAEMDRQLAVLEMRLEGRGAPPGEPAPDAEAIYHAAAALLDLLRRHQKSACDLARSAGGQ